MSDLCRLYNHTVEYCFNPDDFRKYVRDKFGITLNMHQEEAMRVMAENPRLTLSMPRRSGKTTLLLAHALYTIIQHPNTDVLFIARDQASLKSIFSILSSMVSEIQDAPIYYTLFVESIDFDNGSKIYFTTSVNFLRAGRGRRHYIYVDECVPETQDWVNRYARYAVCTYTPWGWDRAMSTL